MELLSEAVFLMNSFLAKKEQRECLEAKSSSDTDVNFDSLFKYLQQVAELEKQSEIGDNVAKKSEWAESLISFATWVFEGTAGFVHTLLCSVCQSQGRGQGICTFHARAPFVLSVLMKRNFRMKKGISFLKKLCFSSVVCSIMHLSSPTLSPQNPHALIGV